MNEADSREIAARAEAAGYLPTADPGEADVVIVNTCTVRERAERRAYGRIGSLRALGTRSHRVRLVVCGCLAEQDREQIPLRAPHVDAVFGTSELAGLGERLVAWRAELDGADAAGDARDDAALAAHEDRALRSQLGLGPHGAGDPFEHLRAFVTVQRGCSYYCTFCIVPYVRGRFDHRPRGEIVAEVQTALARGAREVTLVGQTVNAYRDPAGHGDFADLLFELAELDGLERLAFVTSHPKDAGPRLAEALGSLPVLQPRFHLAVQSGSNAVLRRMNRKYTVEHYEEIVALVRRHAPGIALTTDLIVGFPGERDEDFAATLALCERVRFAQAFTFIYSPRRGTPAAHWEQVPGEIASARLRTVAAKITEGASAWNAPKIGRTIRALVSGPSRYDPSRVAARAPDGTTLIAPRGDLCDADLLARPWLDIRVTHPSLWGGRGEIVGLAERERAAARAVRIAETIDLVAAR